MEELLNMRYFLPLLCLGLLACNQTTPADTEETPVFPELTIATIDSFVVESSVRAIQAVDENTVWWAGSDGLVGHTTDGGANWQIDTIRYEGEPVYFRSVAVTETAAFALSIASPALLYKTIDQGLNWQLVYQEDHEGAFYDAMKFWNDREGIAMGDPTDGCISIIITRDGGDSWQKLSCDQLPPAAEGEAAFAASNSNIALRGDQAWVVTGGTKARILHSPDRGKTWNITQSPIREGGQMTGIFSVDFWDEQQGIIFGGDWNDMGNNSQNKAATSDGGKSWQLLAEGTGPGYRSCVQYFPTGNGQAILAVGIPGISISYDAGQTWADLSDESWYVASFVPGSTSCWLSGGGRIGKVGWN